MPRLPACIPLLALALPAAAAGPVATTVQITTAEQPTSLAQPPGDPGRLFYTERVGRIRIIEDGVLRKQPFLDITPIVSSSTAEQALACMAFHPDYAENGRFFVIYTDHLSASIVASLRVSADPDVADPASLSILLTVPQPDPTHNVAWLGFGPDGYLYVACGDGGRTTVGQFAQSAESLLGKILRIDVGVAVGYAIPPGNPFVDGPGRDEIWAVGLRNPWRCSFDRTTGDLWIADVGDGLREEVDFQPAGSAGLNYGWNCMEGTTCHEPAAGCVCGQEGLALPAYNYEHFTGCAIIGGFLYRGAAIPQLQGRYVFGDHCAGRLWAYDPAADTATAILEDLPWIYSLGEDLSGELYVLRFDAIHRIVFADCNANGIPDGQDIADLTSNDCNANRVPDECEGPDCNANGVPDGCDIADGTSADGNGNLVPDECDLLADLDGDGSVGVMDFLALLMAWGPCPALCAADLDGDGTVGVSDLQILVLSWG